MAMVGKLRSNVVKNNVLTLVIQLDSEGEVSRSGKSTKYFSTGGFIALSNGMTFSANIIGPREDD